MVTLEQIKDRLDGHHPREMGHDLERQAAVALLLRRSGQQTEVLFIRRAEHDADPWSGDLAFPGGGIEEQDADARAAAERETREEIGLQLRPENYLGRSDDLAGAYLSVRISCFVYQIPESAEFRLNGEVVDLFWVPLRTLLEPARNRRICFYYRGRDREHPIVDLCEWSSRPLWGITYRLLDNFLNLFDYSFTYPERF